MLPSCTPDFDSAFGVMKNLDTPCGVIYKNGADICEAEYISTEELNFLYYGENIPLAELDCTKSYCIYMSQTKGISEIHIFETKYQSDVEAIKRMLSGRADFLSELRINPNPSDFFCDTKAECEIFSKGRFVFLIVGNTDAIRDSIEKLF